MAKQVMAEGRYTRLVKRDGWEYVERVNTSGIVLIVAVTPGGDLLLVEQHRPPLGARVIELPAGLAGDLPGQRDEPLVEAARRELVEETGYDAGSFEEVTAGPLSAGLTTEVVTVFVARELRQVSEGGGDDSEDIVVHEIPLDGCEAWLEARRRAGVMVDPKVYMALWFARPR